MLRIIFILPLFAALALPLQAEPFPEGDALILGVFPRRNPQVTERMFTPLARHLTQQLQRPVQLETTYDFASFWDAVANQRYDIVHYNQYHYVRSAHAHGYRVILQNEEFGYDQIAPAIIVRKDSGMESLADLKGRKIVFGGGRKAMIAYIGTTHMLRQAGLEAGEYFEQFALTPIKATVATYYRQAAATGAGHYVLQLPIVDEQVDSQDLRYLATGEAHAHLPWAVAERVSDALAKQIQTVLKGLDDTPQGQRVLKHARLTALNPARDADYDPYRTIIESVLGESYRAHD